MTRQGPGRAFGGAYEGEYLEQVAFPLGGMGAGMVCVEGTGALSHVSVRNRPEVFHSPLMFAAVCAHGAAGPKVARVLEGPVPGWKVFGRRGVDIGGGRGNLGLPHMREARFWARFPFCRVELVDPTLGLEVELRAWSPFIPGNADDSSLPVAGLEYVLRNAGDAPVQAVFSFHARNFMATNRALSRVVALERGFALQQLPPEDAPHEQGDFGVWLEEEGAAVDCAWFRGGWFDALTMLWRDVAAGAVRSRPSLDGGGEPSPGGSVYLPLRLAPGEERSLRLLLGWYVPRTDLRQGKDADELEEEKRAGEGGCCTGCASAAATARKASKATHVPWYAARFAGLREVMDYWRAEYARLRQQSERFSDCFHDTDLPPEVVEAVAANLSILKSPTVLRQADGRLWAWEGCGDDNGCCCGSCTHVWNYAQALPHLFPDLERGLRLTEFTENQHADGHQVFRAYLPIREAVDRSMHAAADGQLGGILKVFREWRVSGDDAWLRQVWPRVRASLDYCIATWDPDERGVLVEPHHNTYDIEFWGPDGMCSSFYLAALRAACRMAESLGDDAGRYRELCERGRALVEQELFNGEYFCQQVQWQGLRADDPVEFARSGIQQDYSPEALQLLKREGPKYQYGAGCLADAVLGCWLAAVCGLEDEILDPDKVERHLLAVYRHNLKRDLSDHANPQRPTYALGLEGGLLLCTWPRGDQPSLPFPYSDEVWTGIEYQVAGHLIMFGHADAGLEIVRLARARYDGRVRNPFDEYECGHWYARALSSYGLLQALAGAVYDARSQRLRLRPRLCGDFRAFLCTATGYGTVGVRQGEPFLDVAVGEIPVRAIDYVPCAPGGGGGEASAAGGAR